MQFFESLARSGSSHIEKRLLGDVWSADGALFGGNGVQKAKVVTLKEQLFYPQYRN